MFLIQNLRAALYAGSPAAQIFPVYPTIRVCRSQHARAHVAGRYWLSLGGDRPPAIFSERIDVGDGNSLCLRSERSSIDPSKAHAHTLIPYRDLTGVPG